jgi:hypothetical protein
MILLPENGLNLVLIREYHGGKWIAMEVIKD